jgi:hypothetical protein
MIEFTINELLVLKLEGGRTNIYIGGKYFFNCKRLLLNIPKKDVHLYDEIDSIDEAAEIYDHSIYEGEVLREGGEDPEVDMEFEERLISPLEEFWAHCSNLQAWAEYDYDTRLLSSNLAFPILKALTDKGDPNATVRFKEEIVNRLSGDYQPVKEYIFVENYQFYLTNEELLNGLLVAEEAEIIENLQMQLNIEFRYVPALDRGLDFPQDQRDWKRESRVRLMTVDHKRVTGLDLHRCDIEVLPKNLFNLKYLETLDLRRNPLNLENLNMPKNTDKIITNIKIYEDLSNEKKENLKKNKIKIFTTTLEYSKYLQSQKS